MPTSLRTDTTMAEAAQGNVTLSIGLLMAASTLAWVIAESRQPAESVVESVSVIWFISWGTSTTTFATLHSIHLEQTAEQRQRHWSTLKPWQNFILRLVATALFMGFLLVLQLLQAAHPVTPHLALTYGPPVISGAAWLNSLWDASGGSLNVAAASSG